MIYRCTLCKTTKSISSSAPSESAHCSKCQCLRIFRPDSDSAPASSSSVKSSASSLAGGRISSKSRSSAPRSSDRFDVEKRATLSPRPGTDLSRSASVATFRPCDYFKLCLEYMLTLGFSKRLFNRKQNRCYCSNCYSPASRDFHIEGGSKYVIPRGWVRFGLYVDDAQAEAEDIWHKWIVSYHGTNAIAAKSIVEHHLFLLPGDQCIGGKVIKIPDNHIKDQVHLYTSPTIAYSSHEAYSPSISFRSSSGKTYKAKIVIQCRQQLELYKIQKETVGAGSTRICPIIPNSEVEYFTVVRGSVIPYGLLIRVFE